MHHIHLTKFNFPCYGYCNVKGAFSQIVRTSSWIGQGALKPFSEIYRNDIMQETLRLAIENIEQCKDCDIRYLCGGACRGFAYMYAGSIYVPDPFDCEKNKMTAQKILENVKRILKDSCRDCWHPPEN